MIYNSVAEIYEAINKTRSKLISTAENLTEEQKNSRENGQGWTAPEIIEHLGIVEGGLVGMFEKLLAKAESAGEGVKSDGSLNPPVSFLEIAEVAKDKKFDAPERMLPHGTQSVTESLIKLQENRNRLNDLRPRIEATDLTNSIFPHPAFGNLNLYQWLAFIGLHEYRHLMQIERILGKTN